MLCQRRTEPASRRFLDNLSSGPACVGCSSVHDRSQAVAGQIKRIFVAGRSKTPAKGRPINLLFENPRHPERSEGCRFSSGHASKRITAVSRRRFPVLTQISSKPSPEPRLSPRLECFPASCLRAPRDPAHGAGRTGPLPWFSFPPPSAAPRNRRYVRNFRRS